MTQPLLPIFVYGTLKRGQKRESLWPSVPTAVHAATTLGRLCDLGPYPALIDGNDLVRGELWQFNAADMPLTLETIDQIECYDQGGVDLYVRRVVKCRSDDGHQCDAYTYQYVDLAAIADKPVVLPDEDGFCQWPAHSTSS